MRPYTNGKPENDATVKMMKDQGSWPRWPWLPIKRNQRRGFPECALLFADSRPIVIKANLYEEEGQAYARILGKAEKLEYSSFEELVADGWVVD